MINTPNLFKRLSLFKCCFLILGCSISFAQVKNQDNLDRLSLDSNYNISVKINDTPFTLKLDTGASKSTIDTNFYNSKAKKLEVKRHQLFLDPVGNKREFPVYGDIEMSLNPFKTEYVEMVGFNNNQMISLGCSLKDEHHGLLGMDVFFNSPTVEVLLINNKNKFIQLGNNSLISKLKNYQEVDVEFVNNQIFLNIKIENKKFKVLLDTGYNGFLTIKKNYRRLKNYPARSFKNAKLFSIIGFSNQNETIIQGQPRLNSAQMFCSIKW